MPKKRKTGLSKKKSKLKTKTMKIDESSSSANQSTKNVKIDETSTSTDDLDPSKSIVMDTGCQDFAKIRFMLAFIDKTMLIESVLNSPSRLLITAPRRFGKSINLSMLRRFFELLPDRDEMERNRKLFNGTLIAKHEDIMEHHQGKYPVLFLDFKSDSTIPTLQKALNVLAPVVQTAFLAHKYLATSDGLDDREKEEVTLWCTRNFEDNPVREDTVIFEALTKLAIFLTKFWKKEVIVLSDEYDSICCRALMRIDDEKELQDVIALCQGTLGCILKTSNPDIKIARGIITGISHIASMGLSTLDSNIEKCKFQEDHVFCEYYGLRVDELTSLLEKLKRESQFESILKHYNGYRDKMLNIYSVMNALNKRKIANYWREAGVISQLSDALKITKVSSIITKLLSSVNNEYEIDYIKKIEPHNIRALKDIMEPSPNPELKNVNVLFNFLLEQGYFTMIDEPCDGKVRIKIPNNEIRSEFREKFIEFQVDFNNLELEFMKDCASIFDKISTSDEENRETLKEICNLLNIIIKPIKFKVKNEATLHHIIFTIIFLSLKFDCFSEIRAAIKNRKILDLLMLYNNIGIIIELKFKTAAEEGLKQIKTNRYFDAFRSDKYNPENKTIDYFLLIGLSMSEEQEITLSVLLNNLDLENKEFFTCN